jgi:hypothetical protein
MTAVQTDIPIEKAIGPLGRCATILVKNFSAVVAVWAMLWTAAYVVAAVLDWSLASLHLRPNVAISVVYAVPMTYPCVVASIILLRTVLEQCGWRTATDRSLVWAGLIWLAGYGLHLVIAVSSMSLVANFLNFGSTDWPSIVGLAVVVAGGVALQAIIFLAIPLTLVETNGVAGIFHRISQLARGYEARILSTVVALEMLGGFSDLTVLRNEYLGVASRSIVLTMCSVLAATICAELMRGTSGPDDQTGAPPRRLPHVELIVKPWTTAVKQAAYMATIAPMAGLLISGHIIVLGFAVLLGSKLLWILGAAAMTIVNGLTYRDFLGG